MPSECHVGFGVIPDGACFVDLVCKSFQEAETCKATFYPDVQICQRELRGLSEFDEDAWHELERSGVVIGPLHVYETIEQGTAVEFCGAWHDDCPIDEAKLVRCLEWVAQLKAQGRLPHDAKIGSYCWY